MTESYEEVYARKWRELLAVEKQVRMLPPTQGRGPQAGQYSYSFDRDEVLGHFHTGLNVKETARAMGVDYGQLHNWMARVGLRWKEVRAAMREAAE